MATRERRKGLKNDPAPKTENERNRQLKQESGGEVSNGMILALTFFTVLIGIVYFYNASNRHNGAFATFINEQIIGRILPKNRYQKG